MTQELPQVAVPEAWKSALDTWHMPDAQAVLAAFLDPRHPVHTLATDNGVTSVARFTEDLHTALAGPSHAAVVTYPDDASPTVAAMLVGEVLGGVRHDAALPLVGPIEVDAESSASRSNTGDRIAFVAGGQPNYTNPNPWHTDAGPWRLPCRWTVLGANHCDPAYADAPTDIVPLDDILAAWTEDPVHLKVLRETEVNWRQIFDGIGELRAPVLGERVFRWLKLLLPGEFADEDSAIGKACAAFDRHLGTITRPYQGYLSRGLLVQDNHQSIHRGPPIDRPSLRRILKVKVGGLPEN